jgi:uncharacterized protein (DUF305 family)
MTRWIFVALVAAGACAGSGSRPALVQAGAPGQPGRVVDAAAARASAPVHSEADVHFMHGMIPHHGQALEMVALVPSRATSEAVRAMALRMEISQRDEIGLIERWLRSRGEEVPAHGDHVMTAPGMLTPEQMQRLGDSRGDDFDRLFLESMIQHHEGAITMVRTLFATSGAGQDSEIFQFANDVEVDQQMEIDRMRALLDQGDGR